MERIDLNPAPLQTPPLHYGLIMAHSDNFIVLTQDWCALCTLPSPDDGDHWLLFTSYLHLFELILVSKNIQKYLRISPTLQFESENWRCEYVIRMSSLTLTLILWTKERHNEKAMPCRAMPIRPTFAWISPSQKEMFGPPLKKGSGWYRC